LLQDKATSGKQGLGIKGLPMKIAGHRWKGNKTSFGDSDDDDSAQSDEFSEIEDDNVEQPTAVESIEIEKNTEKELHVDVGSKTKVKKLCKRILRQV
jgi:Pin2-interacting protein X1